jgi:hypothetical protein
MILHQRFEFKEVWKCTIRNRFRGLRKELGLRWILFVVLVSCGIVGIDHISRLIRGRPTIDAVQLLYYIPLVVVVIIFVGLVGMLCDRRVIGNEKKMMAWHKSYQPITIYWDNVFDVRIQYRGPFARLSIKDNKDTISFLVKNNEKTTKSLLALKECMRLAKGL